MYEIDFMLLQYCGLLAEARGSYERHAHDTYEFHYVVGGRATFEIRGRSLPIGPGDFFYTRPHTEHRSLVSNAGDYLLQYVAFLALDSKHEARVADDLEAHFGEGRPRRLGERYHAFFAEIGRLCDTGQAQLRSAAAFKLAALLYELMAGAPAVHRGHPAVEHALDIMRSSVGKPTRLDSLVAELGIEKSYFIRLFKKSIGVPPMKYAMSLKMGAAADLLRNSDAPLAIVAAQVGFDDEYHFAKRFKQWSGIAPGAYRRRSGGLS